MLLKTYYVPSEIQRITRKPRCDGKLAHLLPECKNHVKVSESSGAEYQRLFEILVHENRAAATAKGNERNGNYHERDCKHSTNPDNQRS